MEGGDLFRYLSKFQQESLAKAQLHSPPISPLDISFGTDGNCYAIHPPGFSLTEEVARVAFSQV